MLGTAVAAALRAALLARARRWAAAVAPGRAFEATTGGAAAAALHGHQGPVLLVAPDVPGLNTGHAAAALDDIADGIEIVLAPATDGLPFLLAFARAEPDLLDLAGAGFDALAAAVHTRAGGLGMLRSERRLITPADARALAADPLAPADVLTHLAAALPVRRSLPR